MKMKIRILVFVAVVVIGSWLVPSFGVSGPPIYQVKQNVVALWKPLQESLPHITAKEFKDILDSGKEFVLIDVREAAEYNTAHLPGAINISRGMLEWETPEKIHDTDTTIYVYCLIGIRSLFAAKRLLEMGYTDVTNISDSYKGWIKAGYPVYNRQGEIVMTPGGFEKRNNFLPAGRGLIP
jgi:rhodanese-related sulfurtransferase